MTLMSTFVSRTRNFKDIYLDAQWRSFPYRMPIGSSLSGAYVHHQHGDPIFQKSEIVLRRSKVDRVVLLEAGGY